MKKPYYKSKFLYANGFARRGLVLLFAVAVGNTALAGAVSVADGSPASGSAFTASADAGDPSGRDHTSLLLNGARQTDSQNGNNPKTGWRPPVAPNITVPPPVDPEQARRLADQWGVQLLSLRLSAAGYMMDFRFRVLDAEKALPLFDHRVKPFVAVDRSKARLPVPMAAKVGAFRTTNRGKNIKADRNYYMMFANPDRHVKAGDKVSVVIGDFKVEHLTVIN